jgi:hypothetical protein
LKYELTLPEISSVGVQAPRSCDIAFRLTIDSVLHGGNFDGDVGSMGAIEVMRALNDGSVRTRHPLAAVIWTNEEGNHFGIGGTGMQKTRRRKSFAKYLVKLRQAEGWSLRELARRSRLSLTKVWNMEKDNHAPTLFSLVQLSRAFGMKLSRFVRPLER